MHLFSDDFPDDPQESLNLFRERVAEYGKGGVARYELQNVIIPHAAICDPAVLYAELPGEFQEWLVERCGEFLPPDTELFDIVGGVSISSIFGRPARIISEEEKRKIEEESRKRKEVSDQRFLKGNNRFYEFLRKTGKIKP